MLQTADSPTCRGSGRRAVVAGGRESDPERVRESAYIRDLLALALMGTTGLQNSEIIMLQIVLNRVSHPGIVVKLNPIAPGILMIARERIVGEGQVDTR